MPVNQYGWQSADGTWLVSETAKQWQPTTTAHDPNPPITLEDAVASVFPPAPTIVKQAVSFSAFW